MRRLSVLVSTALIVALLSGCVVREEVPELIEPVTPGSHYRPVEYGEVGNLIVEQGIVVPKDYCHFYTTNVSIDSVMTDIGEYVEEGQVLAAADMEQVRKSREELKAQLGNLEKSMEIQNRIFDYSQKSCQAKIDRANAAGDEALRQETERELAMLSENHRYDVQLASYRSGKLAKQMDELDRIINEGTLKARHAGYVTYVKDIAGNRQAEPLENVVIVSDYSDVAVALNDVNMDETHTSCDYIYTTIEGKRYTFSEIAYTGAELAKAEALGSYPRLSYRMPAGLQKEVGARIPVCFCGEDKSHVLKIGLDSLYQDKEQYFVYVKSEDGDMERRDVVLGVRDDRSAEVLSGLSDGELVYYRSTSIPPVNGKEQSVEFSNYSVPVVLTSDFYPTDVRAYPVTASDGLVASVKVENGDEVKKGDLIAVLRVGEGASDLKAAGNELARIDEQYQREAEEWQRQIDSLQGEIAAAEAPVVADSDKGEAVADAGKAEDSSEKGEADTRETEKSTEGTVEDTGKAEDSSEKAEADPEEEKEPAGGEGEPEASEESTEVVEKPSKEELGYQLEILRAHLELAKSNYSFTKGVAESGYASLARQYNGDGTMNLYAAQEGKITALRLKEGEKIKAGEIIYTVEQKVGEKYSMYVNKDRMQADPAGLNEKVDFIHTEKKGLQGGDDRRVVASGRCVGIQADSNMTYLSTIGEEVYLTKCKSGMTSRFYAVLDDDKQFNNKEINGVEYENCRMEGVIVLPTSSVYEEADVSKDVSKDSAKRYYVWKMFDGEAVKEYVVLGPSDVNYTVIVSGLEAGDIVLEK